VADTLPVDASVVAANIALCRERIASAGGAGRTRLVAVTKGFGPDAIRAAVAGGADAIGENYAQELERKLTALGGAPGLPVHFIGQIQRNKVRVVAPAISLWHSVDRLEIGAEIARRSPGAAVLVQVNVTREPQRGGCAPEDVDSLVDTLRELSLDVVGLMGVGPVADRAATRACFSSLAARAESLGLHELSMGMSDDLEAAVECGATYVRLGRSLFGSRPPR
jgi:pyridoxal phosphate enzyme (YggS family)